MSNLVPKTLTILQHPLSRKTQHVPHNQNTPVYGKIQQMVVENISSKLSESEKKVLESIVYSFLYYGRAADQTILTAFNEINIQQSKPTQQTKEK